MKLLVAWQNRLELW